jgi:hypothetical protein
MLSRTPLAERRIMLHTRAIATRRSGGRSRKYAPTVVAGAVLAVPVIEINLRLIHWILPESGYSLLRLPFAPHNAPHNAPFIALAMP